MSLSFGLRKALGDNSTYIRQFQDESPKPDTLSVERQIENSRERLQAVGVDAMNKFTGTNFLLGALDLLSRPGYGATSFLREFTNGNAGSTPGKFDPLSAFWRGLTGEEKFQGKDVMIDLGFDEKQGIFGGKPAWYNPSPAGGLGLALDIFNPVDPLNWVGFGVGNKITKGADTGSNALKSAFGASKAAQISDILQTSAKVTDKVGDLAKAGNVLDDIGAETVGKLISQVSNKVDDVAKSKYLSDLMREGLAETGLKATSKLDYKVMRPLQIGLQNPLSIGSTGLGVKLPGYKASRGKLKLPIPYIGKDIPGTFINVPGSEHATHLIGQIAKKIGSTKPGQALGKMFSTAFVPMTVPDSLVKKSMTASNLSELVDLSKTHPQDIPLSISELMKLNDELGNIKLNTTFDFADNFSVGDIKKYNQGNYLSLENLAKKVGLKDYHTEDLAKLLTETPFEKNIVEIYDSLRLSNPIGDSKELFTQATKLRKVMDLMYEQIPEGLKPYFKGTVRSQLTNLYPTEIASHRLGQELSTSPLMAYEFEYKGIPISSVVNTGENFNLNAWSKVASTIEILDELPETSIQALKGQIDISPIPIKSPDTSMAIGDTIVLGRIDKPTVAHEFGHLWDSVAGDPDAYSKAILGDASKIDGSITPDDLYSDYARSLYSSDNTLGIKEDLADSVSGYLDNRQTFREHYPERAKEIERMLSQTTISNKELAEIVTKQRKLSEKISQIPRTESQIKSMIDSVDQYAQKMTWESGQKMYQSFRENLAQLFEQTNWKTKEWKKQVQEIFKGLTEPERKAIMDAAAQITGSEIPNMMTPQPLYSKQDFPIFISKLEEVVDTMPNTMGREQFFSFLKNKGVKDEEIKWTFLNHLGEQSGDITKADVQRWLMGNKLEIQEVWKTQESVGKEVRNFLNSRNLQEEEVSAFIDFLSSEFNENQSLIVDELAKNYGISQEEANKLYSVVHNSGNSVLSPNSTKYSLYTVPGGEDYTELLFTLPDDYNTPANLSNMDKTSFTSNHWDEPNVVAHARFDTRYTEDGKRVLFIEEIQSDWHQQGRDFGYRGTINSGDKSVVDAPFKTSYDELVQKRLLRYAADNGYDGIAWTTGNQQALRWSQPIYEHLDTLRYDKEAQRLTAWRNNIRLYEQEIEPSKLAGYVGSDNARTLLEGNTLSNMDITLGGEGMRKFYDQQIPSNFKKLGKKFGISNIEDIGIPTSAKSWREVQQPDRMVRYALDGTNLSENAENFIVFNMFEGGETSPFNVLESINQLEFPDRIDVDNLIGAAEEISRRRGIPLPNNVEDIKQQLYSRINPQLATGEFFFGGEDDLFDLTFDLDQFELPDNIGEDTIKVHGLWLSPESRNKIMNYSFPLFDDPSRVSSGGNLTQGWSSRQITALDNFLKWRNSVVKQYRQLGIPINELEKYVPFIPKRTLSTDEASALKHIFGTKVQDLNMNNFDTALAELSRFDPNLRSRTTQATRPVEVNQLLKKDWLTEDAAVAMDIRGTRAIKAQEFSKFADEFVRTYGLAPTELGQAVAGQIPEGYRAYKVGFDEVGNKVFREVSNIPSTLSSDIDIFFLPEEMVNTYNEYSNLMFNKEAKNGLLEMYDKTTRVFKKAAYLWNPGHIMRDFQGNVFNNYLMGVKNPMDYVDGMKVINQVDGFLDTPQGALPYKQIYEQAEKLGIIDSQIAYEVPTLTGKTEGRYSTFMRNATYATDGWTRATGFVHNLKKGMNYSEAATVTKKFLFDYLDLTAFERKAMKRVVPFYTWMRKNIPLQVEMMLRNPRILARYNDIQNAIAGEPIDWSKQPKYIQELGAIKPLGSDFYFSPNLPLHDLTKVPINGDALGDLLSSINPLIRAPIESATNLEWWSNRPLEKYAGQQTDVPIVSSLLRWLGSENVPQIDARWTGNALKNIPILTKSNKLLNVFTGQEQNPIKGLSQVSTTFGGPAIFDASSVENSALWEEKNRLIDLIRLLQDQGYYIPTTQELKKLEKPKGQRERLQQILGGQKIGQ